MESPAANKEARARYLNMLLQNLCIDIGIRPSGSKQFNKSVSVIMKEMELALPTVELDTFEFVAWDITGEPEFRCGLHTMEMYPDYGSNSTPDNGVKGTLKKIGGEPKIYEIVGKSGTPAAYVSLSQVGKATPFSVFFRENLNKSLPIFNIGKDQESLLDEAEKGKTNIYAFVKTNFYPGTKSVSIIGTLPGSFENEILLIAHADTQYNTPGANDNTASLITMLMLAHALSTIKHKYTITFAATGGEEIALLGSKHYAETRRMRNDIHRIEFCINFDSLTYGPNFLITSKDNELNNLISDIFIDLDIEGIPRFTNQGSFLDAEPFFLAGARTLYINSRGYDVETLPLWHRPEDLPHTVHPELVENAFRVVKELILRIQNI